MADWPAKSWLPIVLAAVSLILSLAALGGVIWLAADRPSPGPQGLPGAIGETGERGVTGPRGLRGKPGMPGIPAPPIDDTIINNRIADIESRVDGICSHQLYFRDPADPGQFYFLNYC